MARFLFPPWLALAGLLALAARAPAQEQLAIKGGRVVPIAGPPIDGGVVLVRDSKVQAVGKGLAIPSDYRVIDAAGKVVLPGFIEAHSSRGMDQANERNSNVPFLSVIDAIDPGQEYFEDCLRNGVTTVAVVPGNETMIGGQAAVIKTAGTYVEQMIVKRQAGIKISLRPTAGRSRMSHQAALRKELDAARDALIDTQAPLHANTTLGEIAISSMTITVILGGVWWARAGGVTHPRLTAGDLVAMVFLVTVFVRPLQFLVQSLGEAQTEVAVFEEVSAPEPARLLRKAVGETEIGSIDPPRIIVEAGGQLIHVATARESHSTPAILRQLQQEILLRAASHPADHQLWCEFGYLRYLVGEGAVAVKSGDNL